MQRSHISVQEEEVAVFAAASEAFSRKNINCSIDESLERFRPVTEAAQKNGIRVRGYLSCVLYYLRPGFRPDRGVLSQSAICCEGNVMSIMDRPVDDRLRQKRLAKGPAALSDAELLAIFLRTLAAQLQAVM
jgi:hypothetical protein